MSLLNRIYSPSLSEKFFTYIQKRYNTREAIRKYVEPSKFKKHLLTATQPYYKIDRLLPSETCKGLNLVQKPLHPLEEIYVEELLSDIKNSNFILFIQYNYTPFQSDRVYKNTITKLGGKFQAYNNKVYKEVFKRLKKDEVTNLFITRNALITGNDSDIAKILSSLKKMREYILLAGYIDGHLYNFDQLDMIARSPNIDSNRAELVNTLSTHAIYMSQLLSKHSESCQNQTTNDKNDQ